jgi:hypothetical protein
MMHWTADTNDVLQIRFSGGATALSFLASVRRANAATGGARSHPISSGLTIAHPLVRSGEFPYGWRVES